MTLTITLTNKTDQKQVFYCDQFMLASGPGENTTYNGTGDLTTFASGPYSYVLGGLDPATTAQTQMVFSFVPDIKTPYQLTIEMRKGPFTYSPAITFDPVTLTF